MVCTLLTHSLRIFGTSKQFYHENKSMRQLFSAWWYSEFTSLSHCLMECSWIDRRHCLFLNVSQRMLAGISVQQGNSTAPSVGNAIMTGKILQIWNDQIQSWQTRHVHAGMRGWCQQRGTIKVPFICLYPKRLKRLLKWVHSFKSHFLTHGWEIEELRHSDFTTSYNQFDLFWKYHV